MKFDVKKIVGLGIFTAIIIVLQALAVSIRFGVFSITLTLIPIVVGAALYGWVAGAWLGLVFSVMVLITGDANAFLAVNIPGTIITVLVKGTAAGAVAGLVYKLLEKKTNTWVAVIAAAIAAPVTNTGLFLIGCVLFFLPTITEWAGGTPVGTFMITGFVGVNFLVELGSNLILSTAAVQLIRLGKKMLIRKD